MNGRRARQARRTAEIFAAGDIKYYKDCYKNLKRILTRGGQ